MLPEGYVVTDPTDPFETGTGPFLYPPDFERDPRVVVRAEARHCNAAGVVHGGLLMTLADLALCAAAMRDTGDASAVTVSMDSQFLAAAQVGEWLAARAEVLRHTGSLVFVRGTVSAGERQVLSASAVVKRVRNAG